MNDMNGSRVHLWLVRHGQSTANLEGTFAGSSDVSLTETCMEQALALAPKLDDQSFDSVWSSDLRRAMQTARLAFGEPALDSRLREINFGELEGRMWEQVGETYRNALLEFQSFSAPGGENLDQFKGRVLDFVGGLHAGKHLLFVHGGVIRVLTAHLGEDRFVSNGSLLVVDWGAQKILELFEGS